MSLNKIEYAKKLIKFSKNVEAAEILRNIIEETDDILLKQNAIETLLLDIELKKENLVIERIEPLIKLAEKIPSFPLELIEKVKNKINDREIIYPKKNLFTQDFYNIYDFFQKNFLDKHIQPKLRNGFLEINFRLALKTAHNQNIDEPYESWNDLRSSISKEVYNIVYKENLDLEDFENKVDKLNSTLEKKLEGHTKIFYYFLDDIESDIHLILMAIYVGYSEKLINLLLESYKSNYLPCGWKGEYPLGSLCVINGMLDFKKQEF
ncbi:hypothetical protein [Acinetobacter gerneri]|uniref:hypothetical protein n=1 Tax=Acinetobacter gerneri TaxID=202952 RepID=UPI0028AA9037|nr:hypothetical protein [Acinetobacter gerneri]